MQPLDALDWALLAIVLGATVAMLVWLVCLFIWALTGKGDR